MHHNHQAGQNKNVFILLHGTGGDAKSLFDLATYIDPDATLIGIEGEVTEQGMKRYFARYSDGSFDLESLAAATAKLQETIADLLARYTTEDRRVILLGYSNGANIAVNLLKEYETDYDLALLLHPSPGRSRVLFKKQAKLRALITSGANDPYISEEEFAVLEDMMKAADIPVETLTHSQGHQLTQGELQYAKRLVAELD